MSTYRHLCVHVGNIHFCYCVGIVCLSFVLVCVLVNFTNSGNYLLVFTFTFSNLEDPSTHSVQNKSWVSRKTFKSKDHKKKCVYICIFYTLRCNLHYNMACFVYVMQHYMMFMSVSFLLWRLQKFVRTLRWCVELHPSILLIFFLLSLHLQQCISTFLFFSLPFSFFCLPLCQSFISLVGLCFVHLISGQ